MVYPNKRAAVAAWADEARTLLLYCMQPGTPYNLTELHQRSGIDPKTIHELLRQVPGVTKSIDVDPAQKGKPMVPYFTRSL